MKRLIIILTLIFIVIGRTTAQCSDLSIKDIQNKCINIQYNIAVYDSTKTEFFDESSDGAEATAYSNGIDLKIIKVVWLGETGRRIIKYYFDNTKLIFAFNQDFVYNRPYYWDEKLAKENEDKVVFDPKKTVVKEDRYYFKNEKLFLWLNNEKKEVDLSLSKNSIIGQDLITHAFKMKKGLKK